MSRRASCPRRAAWPRATAPRARAAGQRPRARVGRSAALARTLRTATRAALALALAPLLASAAHAAPAGAAPPAPDAAPLAADPPARYYSVVIGSNLPHSERAAELRFAFSDAVRMYRLLAALPGRALLFGEPGHAPLDGDAPERAALRPPSLAAVRAALRAFNGEIAGARAAGWQTHLVVYYAGHGDLERDADGRPTGRSVLRLGADVVDGPALLDLVDTSVADLRHLVLDACQAAAVARGAPAVPGSAPPSNADANADPAGTDARAAAGARLAHALTEGGISRRPEIGVLAATSPEQTTVELAALRGGLLSHVLHSALVGAADADADGVVRYAELYRFARAAGLSGGASAHGVELVVEPPHARFDSVFVDLRRTRGVPGSTLAALRVEPALAGRYRLFAADRLYAEWRAEHGHAVELAVPRHAALRLERCVACEPGARRDAGHLALALAPGELARADRAVVRWPRWESFEARGVTPGDAAGTPLAGGADAWSGFGAGFGPQLASALPLPAARTRSARPVEPLPEHPPPLQLTRVTVPAAEPELERWGQAAGLVLESRASELVDPRYYTLRFAGDVPAAAVPAAAVPAAAAPAAPAAATASGAAASPGWRVDAEVARLDDTRLAWRLSLLAVADTRRVATLSGEAPAARAPLVAALSGALPALLEPLPHVRPAPVAVAAPVDAGAPLTWLIDDAGPPELATRRGHTPAWVGLGLIAGAAALGGVGAWALGERRDAESAAQRTPTDTAARARFDDMHTLSIGTLAGAATCALVGLGLAAWDLLGREPAGAPDADDDAENTDDAADAAGPDVASPGPAAVPPPATAGPVDSSEDAP